MKTFAVVDIGTLKVKTEISSLSKDGTLKREYNSNNLTCFGVGLDENDGNVKEEYLQQTIDELNRVKNEFKKYNVTAYRVVSTHAMRKARNKQEILARILKETTFEVENISQEQEAEFFFQAVMRTFPDSQQEYGVMDVGGGSVQILIGSKQNLHTKLLLPTGTVSLHEKFIQDPQSPQSMTTLQDVEKMKDYILKELLLDQMPSQVPLVYGSSMIIDVMKIVGMSLDTHEDSVSHPYKMYAKHMEEFLQKIIQFKSGERDPQFPGLPHGFGWGIDKAFINVLTIAEKLHSPYIIPSNANIAQGIIYSMAQ